VGGMTITVVISQLHFIFNVICDHVSFYLTLYAVSFLHSSSLVWGQSHGPPLRPLPLSEKQGAMAMMASLAPFCADTPETGSNTDLR